MGSSTYVIVLYGFFNLEKSGVITRTVKIIWGILTLVLFAFEIPMYLYESGSTIYVLSDWICVAAWFLFVVLFAIRALKDKKNRTVWLFASMIYSLDAQYLTDGIKYSVFMIIETIILVWLIATFDLKKTEEEQL